ncbi:hypothetical protein [Flavobacterium sp.]|uniref:hypothetical protein n=1 Tax=Flavobacterium sp. TaxID=239 RepID=UPI0037C09AA2
MKKINNNNIKYQLVLAFVCLTQFIQAQPEFEDGDDVVDVPAAPCDDWIVPMFTIGIVFMFFYFRKQQKQMMK